MSSVTTPATTKDNDTPKCNDKSSESSDSSDSDEEASDSSSDSTSSSSNDEDTNSTTKKKKPSQATQFSVMRSDTTDGSLRMKIAAIPNTTQANRSLSSSNNNNDCKKNSSKQVHKTTHSKNISLKGTTKQSKQPNDDGSSSNTSCCSECTDSDSDDSSSDVENTKRRSKKTVKNKQRPKNVPNKNGGGDDGDSTSSGSGSDSSDNDSSDSQSKNATISAISKNKKDALNSATADGMGGDNASSSDMELPALVNAAIRRVESFSDGDSSKAETTTQYTSSLLRDFMVKTQMMGSALDRSAVAATIPSNNAGVLTVKSDTKANSTKIEQPIKTESPLLGESSSLTTKRKRGRPPKNPTTPLSLNISESPDSGITSIPHSPIQLTVDATNKTNNGKAKTNAKNVKKKDNSKKSEPSTAASATMPKLNLAILEKSIYATERVLYPPRRKKRDVSVASVKSTVAPDELLDPVWRKIDINKKFRRPSVSGYKSDGGTVCSKVLAAQSNYVSDHRSVSQRVLSGYKSDYSCKSKRSGYKSDFSVKAKSCGYRSDYGGSKHRKKIRRKRRLKMFNTKSTGLDLDILQLAGLSLGQSEESSRDSLHKSATNLMKKSAFRNKKSANKTVATTLDKSKGAAKTGKDILNNLCERVTKRLSGMDTSANESSPLHTKSIGLVNSLNCSMPNLYKRSNSIVTAASSPSSSQKLGTFPRSGMITCRRSSAVSHCSSRSASSRLHFRKRRRKRLKSRSSRSESVHEINLSKLNLQIEMMIKTFSNLCHINTSDKNNKAAESTTKGSSKRVVKKRKQSEHVDSSASLSQATTTKRRHKKAVQTQSPDDHKLPLKKRHYLLTPGEKSAAAEIVDNNSVKSSKNDNESVSRSSQNSTNSKMSSSKAITPKKRHLLESPAPTLSQEDSSQTSSSTTNTALTTTSTNSTTKFASSTNDSNDSCVTLPPLLDQLKHDKQSKKTDIITRKKNRLEGLVSKILQPTVAMQNASDKHISSKSSSNSRPTVIRNSITNSTAPPPGVFEPTIELELQIPISSIPSVVAKTEIDSPRTLNETISKMVKDEPNNGAKSERVVESLLNKTGGHLLLKKKRKKQNRTGFPTVKKKKKKISENECVAAEAKPLDLVAASDIVSESHETNAADSPVIVAQATDNAPEITTADDCDRVPKVGETAATFIERNSRPRLSVVSLEKLQGKVQDDDKSKTSSTTDLPATSKRKQRSRPATAATTDSNDQNKRPRESSEESVKTIKKYKNEILGKAKQNLKKNIRTPRDVSSDNEPLINFVGKNRNKNNLKDDDKSIKAIIPKTISKKTVDENVEISKLPVKSSKNVNEIVSNIETTTTAATKTDKPTKSNKKGSLKVDTTKPIKEADKSTLAPTELAQETIESTKSRYKRSRPNASPMKSLPINDNHLEEIERTSRMAVVKLKMIPNIDQLPLLDTKTLTSAAAALESAAKPKSKSKKKIADDESTPTAATTKPADNRSAKRKNSIPLETNERIDNVKSSKNDSDKCLRKEEVPLAKIKESTINRPPPKQDEMCEQLVVVNKEPQLSSNKKSKLKEVEEKQSVKINKMDAAPVEPPKKTSSSTSTKKKDKHQSTESVAADEKIKKTSNDKEPKILKSKIISPTKVDEIKPVDEIDHLEHDPLPIDQGPSSRIDVFNFDNDSSQSSTPYPDQRKQPKAKKRYLCAGLFSDYYKESQRSSVDKSRTALTLDECTEGIIPTVPYCEKYFRQTRQDFRLPYDLWWAHENQKLPGRVPSWNYKKIRTNVYGDVRANPSTDQQPCSCKPQMGCGDDCLNRLMYTECSPKTCPCADKCQNTKIQRHITAPGVERFMTQNKGWGVKAKLPIKKSTYIFEYVGEVVNEREFKRRMATLYTRDTHHYCLNLDGGLVIDGHRMGSDGRFVNHSCSPNCEMQKWSVNGLFRMVLFAMRDIEPNEELTYDYNFSLFNPAEGQPCRCDTPQCRGVIGGKSQRLKPIETQGKSVTSTTSPSALSKGRAGRPKKNQADKNQSFMHFARDVNQIPTFQYPVPKELCFIKNGHCFLLRNMRKFRQPKKILPASSNTPTTLTAQISALRIPRNIRTRGVTIAEHDPTIEKTVRIAGVLREICEELSYVKDKSNQLVLTKLNLPSKKKCPAYYEKIVKPIDLQIIESNVEKGLYTQPALFDEDVLRMLGNAVKFYGIDSAEHDAAQTLLTAYSTKKENVFQRLSTIIGGSDLLQNFAPNKPNQLLLQVDPTEDVIRCICGLYKDEGLMIQCSKCLVWQHTECTGADTSIDNYLCEKCHSRAVDYEIKLDDFTDEGYQYYLSLMRGDLQIRQTDTVYVLRDIPIAPAEGDTDPANNLPKKHTYKTIGKIEYNECDIFRVERLWKDKDGKRFVFGHHYLRPHETYHEPSRKFYQNEVVRVPLYEVVPIDLVMGRCWVLDPTTFCKGRPVDSDESHVYICELRVDKAARLFAKISKHAYPICTKSYAFQKFEQKFKISRNYLPHDVNESIVKPKKKKNDDLTTLSTTNTPSRKNSTPIVQLMPPPPKTLNEKRVRLESNLAKLMTKLKELHPNVQPINLSYLLTGRGARRRANNTNNVPQ